MTPADSAPAPADLPFVTRGSRRAAPPVHTCLDCGTTLPVRRGPGRRPVRCAPCKVKAAKAGPRWEVDPAGLERVCEHFALKHPIHVRRTSGTCRSGTYKGLRVRTCTKHGIAIPEVYHLITVRASLTPAEASRTIAHEACHAAQLERRPSAVREYHRTIKQGRKQMPRTREAYDRYWHHPLEVEARAASDAGDKLKPARAPRR